MTTVILIALILLIAVEVSQLIQNTLVQGRTIRLLLEENKKLEAKFKYLKQGIFVKATSDIAYVICSNGVRTLPDGWRDKLFSEKKENEK